MCISIIWTIGWLIILTIVIMFPTKKSVKHKRNWMSGFVIHKKDKSIADYNAVVRDRCDRLRRLK